jgi:hypothetical protein
MEHMLVHSPEETVWKYVIPIGDRYTITVPKGARFLPNIEITELGVEVWALVTPGNEPVGRTVHLRGTGHSMGVNVGARYLATASTGLSTGAKFVLHMFVDPGEESLS